MQRWFWRAALVGACLDVLVLLTGCDKYQPTRTLFGLDCDAQRVGSHCVPLKKGVPNVPPSPAESPRPAAVVR